MKTNFAILNLGFHAEGVH